MPSVSERAYCPYDLTTDPAEFGLAAERQPTRFGELLVLRRPTRTSDEATLLLHGVGARWTTWTPLLRAAAEQPGSGLSTSDVVAVDLPGFGESENRLGHLDSLEVAAELAGVLTRLGYARARLVGHSMGGLLALDMAARPASSSDRSLEISSLHLAAGSGFAILQAVNHPARGLVTAPLPTALFWTLYATGRTRASRGFVAWLHRHHRLAPLFWPVIAHPRRFPPDALAAIVTEMAPESFRHAAANLAGYDAATRWAAITQPVYAAFGARDRFVDATDRRALAAVRPQAHCTVIPDASHFLHIERPSEVLAALAL